MCTNPSRADEMATGVSRSPSGPWVWLLAVAVTLVGCGNSNGLTERSGVNSGEFFGGVTGVVTSADGTCISETHPSLFNAAGGRVCFTERVGRLGECVTVSSHNGAEVQEGPPERWPVTQSNRVPGGCSEPTPPAP